MTITDDLGQIPMSPFLSATLKRAADYAAAQAHREVTIEHLLLALAEDPEASVVLKSSSVDIARLTSDVSGFLGRLEDRIPPGAQSVGISPDLRRILEAAAAAATQGRRREINGAIVLAAIVGEGRSPAASLLRAQGLTFEEAIRALQRASAAASAQPQPVPAAAPAPAPAAAPQRPAPAAAVDERTTEDILAAARERVQTRGGPATRPEGHREAESAFSELSSPALKAPGVPIPPPPAPPARSAPEPFPPPWPEHDLPDRAVFKRTLEPSHPSPLERTAPPRAEPRFGESPAAAPPPPPVSLPPAMQPSPRREGVGAGYSPTFPLPPSPQPSGGWARGAPPAPPQAESVTPRRDDRVLTGGAPRDMLGRVPPIDTGQLVENIPRRMRVGIPIVVEARIARADVKALAEGLEGGGAAYHHEIAVTKAMSVRLRGPGGGFSIENRSPETQWIENVLGLPQDDFASWRWTVTPRERGKRQLQLVVSARTVAADGLTAETALPDQVIDVRVGVNYGATMRRVIGWTLAAVVGGVLARFGEQIFDLGRGVLKSLGAL